MNKVFFILLIVLAGFSVQTFAQEKPDLCLTTGNLGFITMEKTDKGTQFKLIPEKVLKSIITLCTLSLESKDDYVKTQQRTFYRGIARYYLIRGIESPLSKTFANLSSISESEIGDAAKDLKTASEGGISSDNNNVAYLYAGEMMALLSVKKSNKTYQQEALDLWNSAEEQSVIINKDQAANTMKILADDRQALAEAWKNPVLNSLKIEDKKTVSDAKTTTTVKNNSTTVKAIPENIRLAHETAKQSLRLADKNDDKAAILEARNALKFDPENSLAWLVLGMISYREVRIGDSLIQLGNAIKFDPNDYRAYYWRALIYNSTEHEPYYKDAIDDFNKAIELNPKCGVCFANRAVVYGKLKNWNEALNDTKKALEIIPNLETAKRNLEFYQSQLNEPETISAAPFPKKVEEEVRNSSNTTRSISQADMELKNIKDYAGESIAEINEVMDKYRKNLSCDYLDEAKTQATSLRKYLEKKVKDRDYGNIQLTSSGYNQVSDLVDLVTGMMKRLGGLSCR